MGKLGEFIYKKRKTVLIIWLFLILIFGFFALKLPTVLGGNGFDFNGDYKETKHLLESDFKYPKSSIILLFQKQNEISDQDFDNFINKSLRQAHELKTIKTINSPLDYKKMNKGPYSYAILNFKKAPEDLGNEINDLRQSIHSNDQIKVSITGEPVIVKDLNEASQHDLKKAEMIGLPIALLVLLFAFGSVVASSIPIIMGIVSIMITMGTVYSFSYQMNLSIFILNIIPMIGLALSIDFALLFINRFKEELHTKSVQDAVKITLLTAGRSVIFSGLCVFIGLSGLLFIKIDIFKNVALGGMAVILISVLSAITLLPAILSILGTGINKLTIIKVKEGSKNFWHSFATFVMKKPLAMALIVLMILMIGIIPLKNMHLTVSGTDSLPSTFESRHSLETFNHQFGQNDTSKVTMIVGTKQNILTKQSLSQIHELIQKLNNDDQVSSVESIFSLTGIENSSVLYQALQQKDMTPLLAKYVSGKKTVLNVYLKPNLSKEDAKDWVRNWSKKNVNLSITIGGEAKFEQEIFDEIIHKAPYGLALILLSTFFILMIAFRSLLIPLKAIIMNMLSLSSTFGIIVWVFQGGHFGLEPTDIALILPAFVFSLVFGLSMDYEVFLISRMHEIYLETKDNNQATLFGLVSTSKIITSAAAIMIVVTGAFSFTGVMPVKQIGVGIALAIFIDATLVRIILVPALMKMFGDWNWWFFKKQRKYLKKTA